MKVEPQFIGRADALATQYEGVGAGPFEAMSLQPGTPGWCPLPGIGDLLSIRMHPGPDIRQFRCTARHFDFSAAASPPRVMLELDMP
jgi:hypothetical protein